MARVLRGVGNAVLTVVAIIGVLSVLVWGATQLGFIRPMVVISGSMQPGIMTGDLLIDRPHDGATVRVGEVASLHSSVTGRTVTHRVTSVVAGPGGTWAFTMQGDANSSADAETYVVDGPVWQPVVQVSGAGRVLAALTKPAVAVPLGVTLFALLGITLFPSEPSASSRARTAVRRRTAPAEVSPDAEPAAPPVLPTPRSPIPID